MPDLDLVFWTAATRTLPFEEQLEAAAAGGFDSFAIPPDGIAASAARGIDMALMRRMADAAGVPIRHIDVVTAWAPVRVPAAMPPPLAPRFDVPMDEIRRILDAFDIATILAAGGYDAGAVAQDVLVDGFAALCDEVAPRGIAVDLEFMPFFGLPDLAAAWEIVRAADRPNGGILIDTWHFAKGRLDLDLLRTIPGERLRNVQLGDATVELTGTDLFDETLNYRRFAGEGDMPLVEILSIMRRKGHVRQVGPEVFAKRADLLPAAEVGTICGATTRALLRKAGFDACQPRS